MTDPCELGQKSLNREQKYSIQMLNSFVLNLEPHSSIFTFEAAIVSARASPF